MNEYRGYRVVPANNIMGYEIQHIGRGSLHSSLLGTFTSLKIAIQFIDSYLNGKEDTDGETNSSSGSEQIQRRSNYRRKPSDNS